MKIFKLFLLAILLFGGGVKTAYSIDGNGSGKNKVLFDQYRIDVYKGTIHPPSGFVHKTDGWWDEMGKRINSVEINFAGQYYLGLHSCGAGCRYYSLTNLADGKDLSRLLERFTSNPDEGKQAFFELFFQKNSQLLIARYFKDSYTTNYQECLFLLKNEQLKNITRWHKK